MAQRSDEIIDQGATWTRTYLYEDSNGDPIVINAFWICAKDKYNGTVLFDKSAADAEVTLDGANGSATILFSGADTAAFTEGNYVYDVFVEEVANGSKTRLVQGRLQVTPAVCE